MSNLSSDLIVFNTIKDIGRFEICEYHEHRIRREKNSYPIWFVNVVVHGRE